MTSPSVASPADAVAAADRNPLGIGLAIWLASELMFFAGLFAAFASLAAGSDQWPPPDVHLDVLRSGLFTVLLVASSFTIHLGARAAAKGQRDTALSWLAATVALGAAFLTNQVQEYGDLDFGISSHAYGTIFLVLTGFHGLHVAAGLLLIVLMTRQFARRAPRAAEHVHLASWYWHFVDVVWIGVFVAVYVLS